MERLTPNGSPIPQKYDNEYGWKNNKCAEPGSKASLLAQMIQFEIISILFTASWTADAFVS